MSRPFSEGSAQKQLSFTGSRGFVARIQFVKNVSSNVHLVIVVQKSALIKDQVVTLFYSVLADDRIDIFQDLFHKQELQQYTQAE